MPRHQIHIEKNNYNMIFESCGLKVSKKLFPPYGWGFFFTNYLYHYKLYGQQLKEKLKLRYYLKSLALSYRKQSGNALFYLTIK